MYKLEFNKPIHIYFIGIGGISMSGLAEILLQENFIISGSDRKESQLTQKLSSQGVQINYGQREENIRSDIDLIVYTAAVHEDNPELMKARQLKLPILSRAQLLGQIMDNYNHSVGVSGTHGKTSTTSMISQILITADTDPTISVGGILNAIGGNTRIGNSDVFVAEACEYTNSFFHFYPRYCVILNIEEDHLDFFKDIQAIRDSFHRYAGNTQKDGYLIINKEIPSCEEIVSGITAHILTYGMDDSCDYYAKDISYDQNGYGTYSLYCHKKFLTTITLSVPGIYNISNSLAAIATTLSMGIKLSDVQKALTEYTGTKRRFEKKGSFQGVTVIDDYAHHPTEIRVTLQAAKTVTHKHLIAVFQPHTYTRTKALLPSFVDALAIADTVILADIFAAREKNTLHISSEDLKNSLVAAGVDAYYFPSFEEIENFLLEKCVNGDLLITMGAGDILKVGEDLLKLPLN